MHSYMKVYLCKYWRLKRQAFLCLSLWTCSVGWLQQFWAAADASWHCLNSPVSTEYPHKSVLCCGMEGKRGKGMHHTGAIRIYLPCPQIRGLWPCHSCCSWCYPLRDAFHSYFLLVLSRSRSFLFSTTPFQKNSNKLFSFFECLFYPTFWIIFRALISFNKGGRFLREIATPVHSQALPPKMVDNSSDNC